MRYVIIVLCVSAVATSCSLLPGKKETQTVLNDTTFNDNAVFYADTANPLYIHTGKTKPEELVSYAKNFIGVPYVYASSNPATGFDCSGFITHVFNHFKITVPRSSAGFTNVPHEVPLEDAKPADLILFTGTDSTIRLVGHMGIVVWSNAKEMLFIHSSSGKANGVTITPLNEYYKGDITDTAKTEFHKPFYILFNFAIGGNWPGQTIDNTLLPAKMYIDYIRVYQRK